MLRILLALAVVLGVFGLTPAAASASSGDEPAPVATDVPVVTANPFLPEEADLTSCVGMLQRPGCGSEARGGGHQYAVAAVMVGGLLLIFGRVAWGIRRSQKNAAASLPD
ncbi:MAG TPA: hypothetical protein VK860_15605 [Ilumatobacteraceae bacterium]|nr:hypothetical protein [Ilumatobacteraceae bacterium]